ncbi:MAG: hypothetical protein JO345_25735 [Streptosporangiaceae bacterium]|nr:hypothetical protein [Streptosporangiaceae bacterium]
MWATAADPVFRQANQASATSSNGVTIQCSASLFVVILIRGGPYILHRQVTPRSRRRAEPRRTPRFAECPAAAHCA